MIEPNMQSFGRKDDSNLGAWRTFASIIRCMGQIQQRAK